MRIRLFELLCRNSLGHWHPLRPRQRFVRFGQCSTPDNALGCRLPRLPVISSLALCGPANKLQHLLRCLQSLPESQAWAPVSSPSTVLRCLVLMVKSQTQGTDKVSWTDEASTLTRYSLGRGTCSEVFKRCSRPDVSQNSANLSPLTDSDRCLVNHDKHSIAW